MVWDYGQFIARFCRGQQARGWWSWGRALRDGNCKNAAEESLKYVDRLRHCCKKTLSKIWRGTGWWASKLWTTFLWIFWDESLKSVKYGKELFLNGTASKTQFSTISNRKKVFSYCLSGRAGRKIFESRSWRTKRNDVCAPWPSAKFLPFWLKQTQSKRISLYDH